MERFSNESYAGRGEPYSRMDHGEVSPYADDGTLITPLITDAFAAPKGSGDKFVQAYCFRLCTTQNKSNMVPWPKPTNCKKPVRFRSGRPQTISLNTHASTFQTTGATGRCCSSTRQCR